MIARWWRSLRITALLALAAIGVAGCGWHGLNSLPLPGTEGNRHNPFTIQAQLPDVDHIERNSRVRVGDVTVGNVSKIERQGWHALVTMTIDGDVICPPTPPRPSGRPACWARFTSSWRRPRTSLLKAG